MKPKDKLNKKDKGFLQRLGIRKTRKLIKYSTKLYNTCCNRCKRHIARDSRNIKVDVFCDKCKEKIKPLVDKINRLKNENQN